MDIQEGYVRPPEGWVFADKDLNAKDISKKEKRQEIFQVLLHEMRKGLLRWLIHDSRNIETTPNIIKHSAARNRHNNLNFVRICDIYKQTKLTDSSTRHNISWVIVSPDCIAQFLAHRESRSLIFVDITNTQKATLAETFEKHNWHLVVKRHGHVTNEMNTNFFYFVNE